MALFQLVDLLQREMVEQHDVRDGPQLSREYVPRVFPALHFDDDPSLVHPVATSELGARQKVRPGPHENLAGMRAGLGGHAMRHFDQISLHDSYDTRSRAAQRATSALGIPTRNTCANSPL